MNDNPVQLNQTHIRLNVSENTPIGTELTRIYATDKDLGLNGKVRRKKKTLRRMLNLLFSNRFIIRLATVFLHRVGWIIFV